MKNRPKRIVLCSDGTGNTTIKNRGTNVWKLYEAVDLNSYRDEQGLREQIAFYDDGVGTEEFKLLKLAGGAFGWGLSENVRELYTALCHAYRLGDEIYLFGFSRGAYTVRTLAGLIVKCGIIDVANGLTDAELAKRVGMAYRAFRKHFRTRQASMLGDSSAAETATRKFRAAYAVKHPKLAPDGQGRIKFLGVWDTVDAVGLPFDHLTTFWNNFVYPFKFSDFKLSPLVEKACHAIAIDDERHTFHPVMWDETEETNGRIEQVWFAGAHSNVGGGYPKQGMSLVALDWMMERASADQGLRFIASDRESYHQHQNVHDKLYNSRSGLAVYYRYKPRDVARICRDNRVRPKIHASVLERIALATQGYAPGNLPASFEVVHTGPPRPIPCVDTERSKSWLAEIAAASSKKPLLLDKVKGWVLLRRCAHYALLFLTLVVAGFAASMKSQAAAVRDLMVPGWLDTGIRTISGTVPWVGGLLYDFILRPFLVYPSLSLMILGLLSACYVAGRIGRTVPGRTFSAFWRKVLPKSRRDVAEDELPPRAPELAAA